MPLDAISKANAVDVLMYVCTEGKARFSDVRKDLDLNPSVVNRRLKDLRRADFIRKEKGLYVITDDGRDAAAVLHRFDDQACQDLCDPGLCLGQLGRAEETIRGAAGGWLHELLDATPATLFGLSEAVDRTEAELETQLTMASRWGLIRTDDEMYVPTRSGERVLVLLDAVQGWGDEGRLSVRSPPVPENGDAPRGR